ncbi:MAG: beta-Ala-His dipeptidase [Spirochaetes bacterium]|jgi:dipeptidase D|nr:beta-Ala-His dipeptidase [Spirochaetota bacterium]
MTAETERILSLFEELNAIPRRSKDEGKVREWIASWAAQRSFETKTDEAGNIVVRVPGTGGLEAAPILVLQQHMDMVCEKTPDKEHDFAKDPVTVIRDGDWLKADRTTLGADNGIAVAMAMALAESDVAHPPLELLFTVDEETGLTGATKLDPSMLNGRVLLNLDSEDEGIFTVGCAGGRHVIIDLPISLDPMPAGHAVYTVTVSGLLGGHSGIDIPLNRGNANSILGRALRTVAQQTAVRVATVSGGSAHNAIPRDASATIVLPAGQEDAVKKLIDGLQQDLRAELKARDPEVALSWEPAAEVPKQVMSVETSQRVWQLLIALPHGVWKFSDDIEGFVETSCNLATVTAKEGTVEFLLSQRSSVPSQLEAQHAQIDAIAALAGAGRRADSEYPSWQPNMDSPLLERCVEVYQKTFGEKPTVEAVHAGLEAGVIGAKFDEMDMISLGPTIRNPHSPDERLYIPSIDRVWEFLKALMRSYAV